MEDRETPRMRKYEESKTTRIMMATVPQVTSDSGLMIISRLVLRMRIIANKICREIQITHFMFNNVFHMCAFYEIMWGKNIVEPGRPQMTIWRLRVACRITKATNTHSEYVILIAFPLQQWLHERASMLLYT